ncbi:MAG: sterol desaturase family protein [Oligoflexales bacterium]
MEAEKIIEFISLIVLICGFSYGEHLRPARKIPFKVTKLDIIAVLNLSIFSLLCKFLIPYNPKWSHLTPLADMSSMFRYIGAILTVDFILYWVHRAMHHPLLWKSHRFHHSARNLNWLTGFYTSGTHIAMYIIPQLVFCYYIFGFSRIEMLAIVLLSYFVQLWQHANIEVDGGIFKYIFVTPNSHRVHHSSGKKSFDSNFGAVFSIWDFLFGTYHYPKTNNYPLGVPIKSPLLRNLVGY